jgi:hypothetical protein
MMPPMDGVRVTKAMRRCGDPRSQNHVKNADDSPRLSSGHHHLQNLRGGLSQPRPENDRTAFPHMIITSAWHPNVQHFIKVQRSRAMMQLKSNSSRSIVAAAYSNSFVANF